MLRTIIICDLCDKEIKNYNSYLLNIKPYIPILSAGGSGGFVSNGCINRNVDDREINRHICQDCLTKIFPKLGLNSQK